MHTMKIASTPRATRLRPIFREALAIVVTLVSVLRVDATRPPPADTAELPLRTRFRRPAHAIAR